MSELPDDLAELECRLGARSRPEPNTAFRQRLLASVQDELQREANASAAGFWRYAATLAAAVLLGANLSQSAALNLSWPRSTEDADDLAVTAAQLRQLDAEMSEQEARRQALLLHARSQLVLAPSLEQLLREREAQQVAPP